MDLQKLTDLAIEAALAAGEIIRKSMNEDHEVHDKQGGNSYASQIVTEVDKACESAIISILEPSCTTYDLGWLTEETEDDGSRFEKAYFWCVDPMDGTLAFVNKRPGFAVSIALVSREGVPFIGVVYDPCTQTLYHCIKGKGAFRNGSEWNPDKSKSFLTYVTDRTLEDTPQADEIRSLLNQKVNDLNLKGCRVLSGGGSVMNAIYVLENGPALMLKYPKKEKGGGSIWDFAATTCMFHELNLRATNFNGGKLTLNKVPDTFMNHEGVYFAHI